MNKVQNPKRAEIESCGKFIRKEYGIAKTFEWKVYDYKGKRYTVSQFNNEVNEIERIYCNDCGGAFLPSYIKIVYGSYTCLKCAKQIV